MAMCSFLLCILSWCLITPAQSAKTVKVVLIGQSQSGKSTFIQLLHEMYNQSLPEELAVGTGSKSTTTKCTNYPLQRVVPLTWSPFIAEEDLKCVAGKSCKTAPTYSDMLDQFLENQGYQANISGEPGADASRLELIDTPGYDDSNAGKDENHAYEVLQALAAARSINAFIFMVGKGVHYGAAFQRLFSQYWNTFRHFHDRFVIVHTKWDPTDEDYEENTELRQRDFRDMFPEASKNQHFFIWGGPRVWPKKRHQYPEHKKALAALNLNVILSTIQSYSSVETLGLLYYKTDNMRAIDGKLIAEVDGRLSGANLALENVKHEQAWFNQQVTELSSRKRELEKNLSLIKDRLKVHDTDEEITCNTKRVSHYGYWFSESSTHVKVRCRVQLRSWERISHTSWSRWRNIRTVDDYEVVGEVYSPWWKGHSGTLKALTYKRDYHREKILSWEEQIRNLQPQLETANKDLIDFKNKHGAFSEEQNRLEAEVEALGKVQERLSIEYMPLGNFLNMRHVYQSPYTEHSLSQYALAVRIGL